MRTYTGWKAMFVAVAAVVVVFAALNLLFRPDRDGPKRPLPVVTTVTP